MTNKTINEKSYKIDGKEYKYNILTTTEAEEVITSFNYVEVKTSQFFSKYGIQSAKNIENLRRYRLAYRMTLKEKVNDNMLAWDIQHGIRKDNPSNDYILEPKIFSVLAWLFSPKSKTTWEDIYDYMTENRLTSFYSLPNEAHRNNINGIFIDKAKSDNAKENAKKRKLEAEAEQKELKMLRSQKNNFQIKSDLKDTTELFKHFGEFMKQVFSLNKDLQSKFENMPNDMKAKQLLKIS